MTASTTPALGLMSPVGSDAFQVADFASTFATLDSVPGILTVPNQASRPTGWTGTKHGRRVWQADQNITWIWNQPIPANPGAWLRTAPKGLVASASNNGTVSTTVSNPPTGPTIIDMPNIIIPGGRQIRVRLYWYSASSDNGACGMSYWEDGSLIQSYNINGFSSAAPNSYPRGSHGFIELVLNPAPTTQVTKSFKFTLYSRTTNPGASVTGSLLTVEEI